MPEVFRSIVGMLEEVPKNTTLGSNTSLAAWFCGKLSEASYLDFFFKACFIKTSLAYLG